MTISQPKSIDEEIASYVKAAIEKIDKIKEDAKKEKTQVEADANKKQTEIVKDLAKDFEGKMPTNRICNEIVHQLRGKVHERLIRRCLDEKYKEKHRVANARKQKKKHESTDHLAAQVPLNNGDSNLQEEKKVVIDTMGNEIVEQEDADTKQESMLRDSFDDNNSRPKKDLKLQRRRFLFHMFL